MKFPRYIKAVKGWLYFQRAVPTRLALISPKKTFVEPLRLEQHLATEEQILDQRLEAQSKFALYCKTLEGVSVDAYTERQIDQLAEDVLRRNKVSQGQYAPHMVGPMLKLAGDDLKDLPIQLGSSDHAMLAIPEYTDMFMQWQEKSELDAEGRLNRSLTVQEEAVIRAWEAVQKAQQRKPKTIRQLWSAYLEYREVDLTTRDGKRCNSRFEKFMRFMPDVVVKEDTPDVIEKHLDELIDTEKAKGNKTNSIRRDLNEIVACFNWATTEYRLKWRPIRFKNLKKSPEKQKQVLSLDLQRVFLERALEAGTPDAAALLLMLQSGGMASEIVRLRVDEDLYLTDSKLPYVALVGADRSATKTEERPRFVPIVFGLDLIRKELPAAIAYLSTLKDPSNRLSNTLKKLLGSDDYTSHCLRHTFRINAQNKLINPMVTYTIGGWSGSDLNKVAVNYGSAGFGDSESLKILTQEQKKIFSELVELQSKISSSSDNVVKLRR
jgi:integrase